MTKRTILLCGLSFFAGCSSDGGGGSGVQYVNDLLGEYYSAFDRQCATLASCYPSENGDDDDTCWGPTSGGGSHGWGRSSADERAQAHDCLQKIHARFPDATVTYLECLRDVPKAREECLRACPADVTPCADDVKPDDDECAQRAGLDLQQLVEQLCSPP